MLAHDLRNVTMKFISLVPCPSNFLHISVTMGTKNLLAFVDKVCFLRTFIQLKQKIQFKHTLAVQFQMKLALPFRQEINTPVLNVISGSGAMSVFKFPFYGMSFLYFPMATGARGGK